MNENWRYVFIGLGAAILMIAGLFVSYRWKMNRGIRPSESTVTLFDLRGQTSNFDTVAALPTDSVSEDSVLLQKIQLKQQMTEVRNIADREGFRWQNALQQYRFREPADALLLNLEQEGAVLRDSLLQSLTGNEKADSLMAYYDERLGAWQERLSQQTELLPTALQALEARQISDKEYSTILKQVAALEKKRK